MMYGEFIKLAGQDITYKQYKEIIEPMYNAVEQMSKYQFIGFMMPSIKALAKKNADEQKAAQALVFIGNGDMTPNGCYYYGRFGKLLGKDVSISTGKTTVMVRDLTDEERREVSKTSELYLNSHVDYSEKNPTVRVSWVA